MNNFFQPLGFNTDSAQLDFKDFFIDLRLSEEFYKQVCNYGKGSNKQKTANYPILVDERITPVDIFDPRVLLKLVIDPKTTKIGYKILPVGPFG